MRRRRNRTQSRPNRGHSGSGVGTPSTPFFSQEGEEYDASDFGSGVGTPDTPLFSREPLDFDEDDSEGGSGTSCRPVCDESASVNLPKDGRYRLANDVLHMELRIDLGVSSIVSGDIYAVAEGHREYIAFFRSQPGLDIMQTTNPIPIVIEDTEQRQAVGELEIEEGSELNVVVALTATAQIKALPMNQAMLFVGRLEGQAMREIGIEMEVEQETEIAVTWELNDRTITIQSALEEAGFDVFNVGERSAILTPSPDDKWDDSQLHGLMTQFAQEKLDRPDWDLHLLMLQKPRMEGLNGVMFDSGNLDLNNLPRQGVAIFQHEIKFPIIDRSGTRLSEPRPDWQRKIIQTSVHELGHAFNLAHRFERTVGRADSLSFMNYDWRYLGGQNRDRYWREFAFTFDPDELAFLRHGPRHSVIPGGAEFHTVPYWENIDGGYSPYQTEVPTQELSLNLIPPPSGTFFGFGQPVLLTVELVNNTQEILELPGRFLDPKAGFLDFVIKRQGVSGSSVNTDARLFNPVLHRCFDLAPNALDLVEPGKALSNNVNLTFGSAGFTFMEPGTYDVTAVFSLPLNRRSALTVVSQPLHIRIGFPKTDEEERDAMDLFRSDVGYYLALGGSDVLPKAAELLDGIVARRQYRKKTVQDPLVVNILRCKAINQSRAFVVYEQGKFRVRPPEQQEAQQLLSQISSRVAQVLDPKSKEQIDELVASVGQKIHS